MQPPAAKVLRNKAQGKKPEKKPPKKHLDWAKLGFEYMKTDYRFSAICKDGKWNEGGLIDSESMTIHEGAPALHYAQQCFEGMKAHSTPDGRVVLFRPRLNQERMERTADRLLMQRVPPALFRRGVEEAVRANYAWVPPHGSGASLYIRPLLIGVGENLGLKPAKRYEFRVFVSPVGPYFKQAGLAAISLAVSDIDRAAPRGTGNCKAGANYAGGLLATRRAQEAGADEALYLDAASLQYIDEAGSANIVIAMKDGKFVAPQSDAILPSVTRKSLMTIAAEKLGMPAEERPVDLRAELANFAEAGACGTAAVLSPIGRILMDGKWHNITGDGKTVGPVMQECYDQLTGIQQGVLEDEFGWLHEVKIP